MKKNLTLLIAVLACIAIAFIVYRMQTGSTAQDAPVNYTNASFSKTYQNDQFHFSLNMPENFEARELPQDESGATTLLIESVDRADGVQIVVSPFDEDLKELTQERILQDVPDLEINDAQPVEIGLAYKGLAFKSNNEAFDGESREVWFVFRGYLYQISTYNRLDPLLKSIFGTWKFL